MRISEQQRSVIKQSVQDVFGQGATVRLFGSRADDSKRGGDIDLYVEVDGTDLAIDKKASMLFSKICQKIGDELPIDIVVKDASTPEQLIHREGMKGVIL